MYEIQMQTCRICKIQVQTSRIYKIQLQKVRMYKKDADRWVGYTKYRKRGCKHN
jgi:hypothetical protein